MKQLLSNWRLQTAAAKHGAEGGEKGEVGEQGRTEGEEGEAEDRMMERGKGVEGEAAAEQGGAEGEEGEAEDSPAVLTKPSLCHLSALASLPLTGDAREGGKERLGCAWASLLLLGYFQPRCSHQALPLPSLRPCLPAFDRRCTGRREGEAGVCMGLSSPIGLFSAPLPAVLTKPSLCHLSALASLPLTGDARGGGRERRGCAWASLLLLGYFQPRCSHQALPLPSLHPCLPAIDRRCTGRREGEAGVCMGLSSPIGLFSAPLPAVLTKPSLCHLSALASLPLTGDARGGGKERLGCAWASLLLLGYFQPRCSHQALPLPSLRPCLPAIDRRCTGRREGEAGVCMGLSSPIGLFSAPLFSPSPPSAISPPLPPCL
ncbi:unnamed protein product [Closterium sp. NIES-53]